MQSYKDKIVGFLLSQKLLVYQTSFNHIHATTTDQICSNYNDRQSKNAIKSAKFAMKFTKCAHSSQLSKILHTGKQCIAT